MTSTPRRNRRTRAAVGLLAGALLAASCSSSDDATTGATDAPTGSVATPSETSTAPDAPVDTEPSPATDAPVVSEAPVATEPPLAEFEPIDSGPYDVGVQTITILDEARQRPLTVDVWFPIADATGLPPHQYTLLPGVYYESPTAVSADASVMASDGPYPLVVYSHGSGGLRYLHSNYAEAMASHGYIVAAPDHTGNTATERITGTDADFDVTALNRPQDVAAVIDQMTSPENVDTAGFVANVDPESIAVTGHSFGGFTAYAMASGYANDVGTFEADPRVDAIISLAPATGDGSGRLLSDERLASITVPSLVMVGTNDQTTPAAPNVDRPWELSNSDPSYRVDLLEAQHQSFTDMCDYQQTVPLLPEVPAVILDTIEAFAAEGCTPADMPIERVKEVTNTFAIAFLESIFRDGTMIDETNTEIPDDVIFSNK
jgi:predicted dienelactone hydrolase